MVAVEIRDGGAYLTRVFKASNVVFLSGGFGSEVNKIIEERGLSDQDVLQKGSTFRAPIDAQEIIQEVHEKYADAGADILTADTFNASYSRQGGDMELAGKIVTGATWAAEGAARNHWNKPLVALSLTSSGDCYLPNDTPDDATLRKEHTENVKLLVSKGDFVFAETLPTLREGSIIAEKLQAAQKPFLISFVVNERGNVLDGSTMEQVVNTVLKKNSYCMGVLVNCGDSIKGTKKAIKNLGAVFNDRSSVLEGKRFGAYPNGFKGTLEENCSGGCNHKAEALSPSEFADVLYEMVADGATIVGGCCGTTPLHTKTYTQQIKTKNIPVLAVV